MGKFIDLTGQRFGRLVVIKRDNNDNSKRVRWLCKCDCGKEVSVLGLNLYRPHTRSCGCLKKEIASVNCSIHNLSKTKIYKKWIDIKNIFNRIIFAITPI